MYKHAPLLVLALIPFLPAQSWAGKKVDLIITMEQDCKDGEYIYNADPNGDKTLEDLLNDDFGLYNTAKFICRQNSKHKGQSQDGKIYTKEEILKLIEENDHVQLGNEVFEKTKTITK